MNTIHNLFIKIVSYLYKIIIRSSLATYQSDKNKETKEKKYNRYFSFLLGNPMSQVTTITLNLLNPKISIHRIF